MKKNYLHNVIRIRVGKNVKERTYWIIAILNKKKTKSLDIVYKLGYVRFGPLGQFVINLKKLAFFLNKGFIIKKSVKKILKFIV